MAEDLLYKNVRIVKAAVEFSGSEKLEKARKTFLVFLTIILFLEFANIEIQSATLAIVVAKIHRPWVVTAGLWLLFLYSFAVYFFIEKKELALFAFRNSNKKSFFSQLNRDEFVEQLKSESGLGYLQPGTGLVKQFDDSVTKIQYDVENLPKDVLKRIDGFDYATSIFTYMHQPEDHAFFNKVVPFIRPAIGFNYLVYVFPIHVGFGLITIAVAEQLYSLYFHFF